MVTKNAFGYGNTGPKVKYTDKNAEIQRTMQVLKNRTKEGMDNSAQLSHYKNLTGQDYKPAFDKDAYLKEQQGQVNSIYDNQTAARTAQFNAQRDKALGLVNQQKAEIIPQYASKRNQTDVVSAQNVNRLREMMAAQGIASSGENVTANVGLQSARQGALSNLNLQEQQTNNDFNRQITDINDPSQLNAMLAELNAQRSQALMQAGNRADEMAYSRERDSVGDSRYADETQYGRGQDTKQWDYQTGRDSVNDGRYTDETQYGRGRDSLNDKRYADEMAYKRQQDAIVNRYRGSSGGGGGSSYGSGGGGYSTPLPSNPTPARIMTEKQYIDAFEEPDARKKGTARILPGSTMYEKMQKNVFRDLYK